MASRIQIIDNGCPDIPTGGQRLHGRAVLIRKLDTPVLDYCESFNIAQMMYFVVIEFNSERSAWLWDGYQEN